MTKSIERPLERSASKAPRDRDREDWMNLLADEIRLLPETESRRTFEDDYSELESFGDLLHPATFQALRAKVTVARFERASAELKQLRGKLNATGGGMLWTRQPGGKMLSVFLQGPSAWPDTIDTSFKLADELYNELTRRIDTAIKAKDAPRGRNSGNS